MKNLGYFVIGVAAAIVILGVLVLTGLGTSSSTQTTTAASTSPAFNNGAPNNSYKSTTSVLPSNSSVHTSAYGCTASKYFMCNNATYEYPGTTISYINATIGQNTSEGWSSFGVGYAPQGTAISGGIPHITFYTPNDSSNNVGPSLKTGSTIKVKIPVNGTGASTTGTVWACYVNSGVLYVGNGCLTSGGVPATYVAIGILNLT